MLTIENFMKLWSYVLFGGGWMIFVLTVLGLFLFTAIKVLQIGTRIINRYFEKKMRGGQITKKLKKVKKAVVKHFAFKEVRKRNGSQNEENKKTAETKS
jgi:hypothetical protein